MRAIPTVSILVLLMIIGAIKGSPSSLSILLFLAALYCVGARLVGLFVRDSLLQVTVGLQVGLGIVVLAILVPFATMVRLPIGLNLLIGATIAVSTLLMDIGYAAKGELTKNDLLYYAGELRRVPIRACLPILAILCAALVLRVAYQMNNASTILPDGALNFAAARALSTSKSFSANVLSDAPVVSPFSPTVGLNAESGTWFILSVFFLLGGVSFGVDLTMLLAFGLLLLLPVYAIGRLWFGSRAWVPVLLASCLPILMFFSSVPYGPEITSSVFAVSGVCTLECFRLRLGRIPVAGFAFAGLLFSVSAIAWEPLMALVYILGYGFVLMLQGPGSNTDRLLFLPLSALFGISVLSSETWSLNPWLYTLFVFLLSIVGWVWKRRQPGFELVIASASFTFSLWLSRFYLLPQYFIDPSLAYPAKTTALTALPFSISASTLITRAATYVYNLQLGGTYPLILLAVASILLVKWAEVKHFLFAYVFLLLDAIAIIVVLNPSVGFFENFVATRFLIGSYLMLVMLSSATIIRIAEQVISRINPSRTPTTQEPGVLSPPKKGRHLTSGLNRKQTEAILVVFLLAIGPIPLAASYAVQYNNSVAAIHTEDYPQFLGVLSAESWIQQNIPSGTVFQVTSDDSARVWAMEIPDMSFAALNVVRNGTIVPLPNIEIGDVLNAASSVNASYVIFDSDVIDAGMTNLLPYYNAGPSAVGQDFPVFTGTQSQSEAITYLRLVFYGGEAPDQVLIYKIESPKPTLPRPSDFEVPGNSQAQHNESIDRAIINLNRTPAGRGLPVGVTVAYIVLGALVSLKSYESVLELRGN